MCNSGIGDTARRFAAASALIIALAAAGPAGAWNFSDNDQFSLMSVNLVGQTPMGNETELVFSGVIRNLSVGQWSSVSVVLDGIGSQSAPSLPPGVRQTAPMVFDNVGPSATVASIEPLVIIAPNGIIAILIAQLTAGNADYEIFGTETPAYRGPVEEYDEESDLQYQSCAPGAGPDEYVCSFAEATALLNRLDPGDFLIIGSYRQAGAYALDAAPAVPSLLPKLPAEVLSVAGSMPLTLTIRRISDPTEIVETGSFEDVVTVEAYPSTIDVADYDIQVGDCNPEEAPAQAPCYLPSIPIRFNDIELGSSPGAKGGQLPPGLTLSGELTLRLFRPNGRIRIRPGDESSIMLGFDAGYSLTLTAEAQAQIDLLSEQAQLFTISVPVTTINVVVPIYVTVTVSFVVGAEGTLEAGTTFSFHQEGTAELGLEWSTLDGLNGISDFDGVPAAITIPELSSLASANTRVWGGLEAALRLSLDPTNILGAAGPVYRFDVGANLEVNPLAPQPWSVTTAARHQATFEVHLPAWEVSPLESEEFVEPLNSAAAPATKVTAEKMAASPVAAGKLLRWARVLSDERYEGSRDIPYMEQKPLYDEKTLFYGYVDGGDGFAGLLDRRGVPLWERELDSQIRPVGGAELPDGTLLLAGNRLGEFFVMILDRSGEMLSYQSFSSDPACTLTSMALGKGPSAGNILLLGYVNQSLLVSESDVCIMLGHLEAPSAKSRTSVRGADGINDKGEYLTFVYQRADFLESFGNDEARDVAALDTGDFAFAGTGEVESPELDDRRGGLLGLINADGTIDWLKLANAPTGEHFSTVTAAPDGTIYAGGTYLRCVCDDNPALWLARINADGSGLDHYLYDQDFQWEDEIGPWVPTSSGSTPYDKAYDLAFDEGGLIVAGKTGKDTDQIAAWLMRVNPNMAVDWHVTYDGLGDEIFYDVTPAQGGLQILGSSTSHLPDGARGLLLMRVPNEGRMRFADDAATFTRYVQPRVDRGVPKAGFDTSDGAVFDVPYVSRDLTVVSTTPTGSVQAVPFSSSHTELAAVNRFNDVVFVTGFED